MVLLGNPKASKRPLSRCLHALKNVHWRYMPNLYHIVSKSDPIPNELILEVHFSNKLDTKLGYIHNLDNLDY